VKDDGVSDEKLLVARSNEKYGKIYMEDYDICQKIKNKTKVPAEKSKLSEVPEKPWTHLIVYFIMKLPLAAEKDAILVVCNILSKITHFVATTEETLVEGLAQLFKNNV